MVATEFSRVRRLEDGVVLVELRPVTVELEAPRSRRLSLRQSATVLAG